MTQSELKANIEKLDKALKSPTTPDSFKASLKAKKEKFESELKALDNKPAAAAPKAAAPKSASPKAAAPKAAAPKAAAKKPTEMSAADKCRELLKSAKAKSKSQLERVDKRRKQGKPATLTPSEAVVKTAKVVQSKVVAMTKDLSQNEIDKLSTGFVMAIKNALNGIKNNSQKHNFIKSIITDLNNIDKKFTKTAEHGGYMEDGGYMAKGGVIFEVGIDKGDKYGTRTIADFDTEKEAKNFIYEYQLRHPNAKLFIDTAKSDYLTMAKGGTIEDRYTIWGTTDEGWFAVDKETKRAIHPTEFGRNIWETKQELLSDLNSKHMARGGTTDSFKFEVGDKVMVDDSGYTKLFHGFEIDKPATIISKRKTKFGGKTYFLYDIETADGRKPHNSVSESKLKSVGMADGGYMAGGGRPLSAINRDRAYESQDELWEKNYTRTSRPKHPKYNR